MEYSIYAIIDPRSDEIFYIGETGNFELRRKQHLNGTDQLSGLVIKQIRENGFVPLFVVLERCESEESALMAEIYWIETMKARGAKLMNAQGFSGYSDRRAERDKQTSKLNRMTALRWIANGRDLKGAVFSGGWSKRDISRLNGMKASGMKIALMAKNLGRPVKEIREKLSEL